jgi:hypothetical protein
MIFYGYSLKLVIQYNQSPAPTIYLLNMSDSNKAATVECERLLGVRAKYVGEKFLSFVVGEMKERGMPFRVAMEVECLSCSSTLKICPMSAEISVPIIKKHFEADHKALLLDDKEYYAFVNGSKVD